MENYVEEKRLRKKTSFESPICPICGITIRENELELHYRNELEKLAKVKKVISKTNSPQTSPTTSTKLKENKDAENAACSSKNDNGENCWGTYQKIKENRVRRTSKLKSRKRKVEDKACPICFKIIIHEDLHSHVDNCLRKQENQTNTDESDEDEMIDVGETYNWCGQTRIRSTTLFEGSLSSIGTCITKSNENEDEHVNIDEEDVTYGASQYTEKDIILLNKADEKLRDLITATDIPSTSFSNSMTDQREENNQNVANSVSTSSSPSSFNDKMDVDIKLSNCTESLIDSTNQQMIIDSLKAKIREYENAIRNRPKCLICLSPDFENPVVSVQCWHVYCEKCWLHTLGAKKLCPQCNMITAATDLRRIYL